MHPRAQISDLGVNWSFPYWNTSGEMYGWVPGILIVSSVFLLYLMRQFRTPRSETKTWSEGILARTPSSSMFTRTNMFSYNLKRKNYSTVSDRRGRCYIGVPDWARSPFPALHRTKGVQWISNQVAKGRVWSARPNPFECKAFLKWLSLSKCHSCWWNWAIAW